MRGWVQLEVSDCVGSTFTISSSETQSNALWSHASLPEDPIAQRRSSSTAGPEHSQAQVEVVR
jgi:hypothetical protein